MLAVVVVLAAYALYRPAGNADLVDYIATVRAWQGLAGRDLSDAVYPDLQAFLAPAQYADVTGAAGDPALNRNAYLHTLATDPDALTQQIPFYSVKPLYPALMLALGAVLPLGLASVVISAVAYALLGLLVFGWAVRHLAPWRAWAAVTLLLVSPPFWVLAQLSSPDSLALLLVAAGLFVFVEWRRPMLAIQILAVAILARPNVALLAIAVIGAAAIASRESGVRVRPAAAIMAGIACVAVVAALQRWSGNYGLGVLYYHAVVAYLPYPSLGAPGVPPIEVVREIAFRTIRLALTPVPWFVLAGTLAVFLRSRRLAELRGDPVSLMVVAALAALVPGWLTYPNEPERILVGSFLALAMALMVTVGDASAVDAQ